MDEQQAIGILLLTLLAGGSMIFFFFILPWLLSLGEKEPPKLPIQCPTCGAEDEQKPGAPNFLAPGHVTVRFVCQHCNRNYYRNM